MFLGCRRGENREDRYKDFTVGRGLGDLVGQVFLSTYPRIVGDAEEGRSQGAAGVGETGGQL